MQLWVGLGNPCPLHAMQRHNVGFMAADILADLHGFGAVRKQFLGWTQEGRIGGTRILLLKPATFMNDSGQAVSEAMRFHKLGVEALTVFHDELDLAPFKVKVKRGGGAAGHNGLRSIDRHVQNLGGPEFRRVRLGIGHPGHKDRVLGYVLGNYTKDEVDPLADMLGAVGAEAEWLAKGDDARFMNDVRCARRGPEVAGGGGPSGRSCGASRHGRIRAGHPHLAGRPHCGAGRALRSRLP